MIIEDIDEVVDERDTVIEDKDDVVEEVGTIVDEDFELMPHADESLIALILCQLPL